MSDSQSQYRWPRFVLAAVLLGLVLAIFWVTLAARNVAAQRDSGPLPVSAPAR